MHGFVREKGSQTVSYTSWALFIVLCWFYLSLYLHSCILQGRYCSPDSFFFWVKDELGDISRQEYYEIMNAAELSSLLGTLFGEHYSLSIIKACVT
ncbi:hypothetical protein SRHO_G00046020 [Serrasalmus rhombeus]